MSNQDYRVSTIVILCKDCGNDVGMYPGRHKCPPPPAMPAMPSIPSRFLQSEPLPAPSSRSNGRRPADPAPDSYGSRAPTSSSFQDRVDPRTPAGSSFQDRLRERDREKQQREREEREAVARAVRAASTPPPSNQTNQTTNTAAGAGTSLWNRLMAAKDVISTTITGEERWPDSDDSDFEGETHISRVLREHNDKKEDEELAAKIAELDATPVDGPKASGAGRQEYGKYRGTSGSSSGPSSIVSSTSSNDRAPNNRSSNDRDDRYGRSLRSRGEPPAAAAGPDPNERSWSPSPSQHLRAGPPTGNRYRTSSDASRDDALSRLEGKKETEKLAAHVNNLGSTSPRSRGASPNRGPRPQDGPPPQQQPYGNQLTPSSAGGAASYQNYGTSPTGSNRRYDSPSPGPGSSGGRYAPQQSASSPSFGNNNYGGNSGGGGGNNYRQQPPSRGDAYSARASPEPSMGYGRPEYERRPTYPPTGGPPPGGNNLGAYGQRQQHHQQQRPQQQHSGYGSQGNYF
ncbi:hypothetical protein B0O80DRAFT_261966 [Mortierella sp. GBAus27b]|nr:hypothetical protein B0O80DRAFT_261966 [Mortierella sp. GBAus27b]